MIFPNLKQFPYFGYDTETTGLNWPVDKMFSFSISTPDGQDYYYDIRQTPKAKDWLTDQLFGYTGHIICHNASYDYRMSTSAGISIPITRLDDTVIRACLINEHLPTYELDYLAKKYLGKGKDTTIYEELAKIFGGLATRNVQIGRIKDAPIEVAGKYAKLDTRRTLELWEFQQKEEIQRQGIEEVIAWERSLMPTFIRSEMRGIRVDVGYAEQAMDKLTPVIDRKQKELNKIFGVELNVNSPKQIKELFNPVEVAEGQWETSDGVPIGTTPKGGPSINAEVLRSMEHPAARYILDIRSLLKTRDTFLGKHVLEHSVGGRVYPTINQSKGEDGGAGTGRVQYSNPAMGQIPNRDKEVAAIVKPCFLPDEGQVWVSCDEASFEVRTFAHLIGTPDIVEAYNSNPDLDFHNYVSSISGLPRNASYPGEANAKQLNLSMIFNSGDGAIAEKMGMSWYWDSFTDRSGKVITYKKPGPEAQKVIARYHQKLPGVKKLAEKAKRLALQRGYIKTFKGRRLRFPNGYKAYKASGLLIQSTAAEWNKENWLMIEEQLDGEGHLILNTHDSYDMSMPEDWKPHYERVRAELEKPRAKVPLILDFSGVGHNWWDAICKSK